MAAFDDNSKEARAAEYALGTLSAEELVLAERELATDPAFARLVAEWEKRLSPLALALEPVTPPTSVKAKVLAAIAPSGFDASNVVQLQRRVTRWRVATAAVSALAAGLVGVMLLKPPPAPQGRFVAVLQTEGPGPAFLASVDLTGGTISVRTVGAEPQEGKSYELWALGAGRDKPQSLGVIAADFRIPANKLGRVEKTALNDTLFAVSLEPEGGSPTGQPTGPVLFTGKLVETE
jgi:anti-sigma-K factor RskA